MSALAITITKCSHVIVNMVQQNSFLHAKLEFAEIKLNINECLGLIQLYILNMYANAATVIILADWSVLV